jgi:hypothetical protein
LSLTGRQILILAQFKFSITVSPFLFYNFSCNSGSDFSTERIELYRTKKQNSLLPCASSFYSSVSKQYVKGQGEATSPGIPTASAPKWINQVLPFPMTMMLVSRANLLLGIESNGRFPNAFSLCSLQQHNTQSRIFLDRIAHNLTPLLYTTFRVSDLSLSLPRDVPWTTT